MYLLFIYKPWEMLFATGSTLLNIRNVYLTAGKLFLKEEITKALKNVEYKRRLKLNIINKS
jgi:hypothetical protein